MADHVETREEITRNVDTLYQYGLRDGPERTFHDGRIKNGKVFVAVRQGDEYRFAPSKFAGYAANNLEHENKLSERDGGKTNQRIESIAGSPIGIRSAAYRSVDAAYLAYCDAREGQHPAIIEPETWEAVQAQLRNGAAKRRSKTTGSRRSPLCGKLFDDTCDRLTPSHSKTKKGVRLRYYISHRLVAKSGEAQQDAWRLPAAELESRMVDLLRKLLPGPGFVTKLLPDATTDQIGKAASALAEVGDKAEPDTLFGLITRIDVAPGRLDLQLNADAVAKAIGAESCKIAEDALFATFPFRLRKRGVETKIILADAPAGIDEALIRNIARAHLWFEQIKTGSTLSEIAKAERTTNGRIHKLINLAFLAPDIIRDILDGKQPLGFTSDWCVRHTLPGDWQDQRMLIATL